MGAFLSGQPTRHGNSLRVNIPYFTPAGRAAANLLSISWIPKTRQCWTHGAARSRRSTSGDRLVAGGLEARPRNARHRGSHVASPALSLHLLEVQAHLKPVLMASESHLPDSAHASGSRTRAEQPYLSGGPAHASARHRHRFQASRGDLADASAPCSIESSNARI